MGMAVDGGGGGGGRSRRRGGGTVLSEINVTPFVDVMLVLLIIFMLTAHVMEYGLEVDVPRTRYVQETTKDLPIVTIDKTGDSTLNGSHINIHALVNEIHRRFPGATGVYVRADAETQWDPIAQVTAELGQGKLQVYMVTQPDDTAGKRRR
jgi:biopolymer transport protein ExbD